MKHSLKITIYLVILFFVAQVAGLIITSQHLPKMEVTETGETFINNQTSSLPGGAERPETSSEQETLLFIVGAVLFGTILLLLLIKFRLNRIWKGWFYVAITLCLYISISSFLPERYHLYALIAGIIIAYFKIIRHNIIVHNLTEILIYGALGALFVPMEYMNLFVAVSLLLLISAYDMFAVWKSKHMVKLAEFQTQSKVFAGLFIPYKKSTGKETAQKSTGKTTKGHNAILGGGDIAFPLIFSGVILKGLLQEMQFYPAFFLTMIVSISATAALLILFIKAEKGKFYPAMPFISAGCFVGLAITMLF
ncbi:MAG: presenilin family intramembrane aspartyl protease [Candidatus Woesearchaeota archaeon]